MVVTAFVAVSLTASALEINTELELSGNGIFSGYYVGSTGNTLTVWIEDIDTSEDMSDAYVNITTTDPDIDFTLANGNNNDNPYDTGNGEWLREGGGPGTRDFTFMFNVDDSCPIGDHTATLLIDYDTSAPSPRRYGVERTITIVISSRAITSTT
ncbi:MAG: hypothetical protein JSV09_07035, partial [Thermoplasmata archaeon]